MMAGEACVGAFKRWGGPLRLERYRVFSKALSLDSEGRSPSSDGNLDVCFYLPLLCPFSLAFLRVLRAGTVMKTSGKPVAALDSTDAGGRLSSSDTWRGERRILLAWALSNSLLLPSSRSAHLFREVALAQRFRPGLRWAASGGMGSMPGLKCPHRQ